MQRLLAVGWQGWVTRQLAVEPLVGGRASAGSLVGGDGLQETLGLVPAHW